MMGAVHRYHPDPEKGDPPDAFLYDGCERCDEHAAHPLAGLDSEHLAGLVDLDNARTDNEAAAHVVLQRVRADAYYLERSIQSQRSGEGF